MEKINKHKKPSSYIYKLFIYVALLALAISIIIPVAWVFMASLKKNSEFIGGDVSPWALPKEFFCTELCCGIPRCEHGNVFLKFSNRYCNSIDPPVTSCTSGILCTVKI